MSWTESSLARQMSFYVACKRLWDICHTPVPKVNTLFGPVGTNGHFHRDASNMAATRIKAEKNGESSWCGIGCFLSTNRHGPPSEWLSEHTG